VTGIVGAGELQNDLGRRVREQQAGPDESVPELSWGVLDEGVEQEVILSDRST
jgi:hypothetical protein